MAERCRSCKAQIRWAITDTGRLMPLDFDPVDDGNIRLGAALDYGGTPRAIVVAEQHRGELAGELYRSHLCPYASEHRRPR